MRILIDCRPLQYLAPGDERARLIVETARELAVQRTIEFLYVIDKQGAEPFVGVPFIRQAALPGRTGWKLWYDWKLPKFARKCQADWIMTTGGVAAAGGLPQIAWIPGGKKGAKGLTGLAEKRMDKSLQTAKAVFCFSAEDLDTFTSRAKDKPVYLTIPTAGHLAPLDHDRREEAKVAMAGGKEYFFTDITGIGEDELIHVLKAFSRFKKRQLTNLQMVLAGTPTVPSKQVSEKLDSYKYRQDVHWHKDYIAGASPAGPGGAYAVLRPFSRKEPGLAVVEAWKMEVPVIVSSGSFTQLADPSGPPALLYAQALDNGSLAEKLMTVYKDERLRSLLIEEAKNNLARSGGVRPVDLVSSILGF